MDSPWDDSSWDTLGAVGSSSPRSAAGDSADEWWSAPGQELESFAQAASGQSGAMSPPPDSDGTVKRKVVDWFGGAGLTDEGSDNFADEGSDDGAVAGDDVANVRRDFFPDGRSDADDEADDQTPAAAPRAAAAAASIPGLHVGELYRGPYPGQATAPTLPRGTSAASQEVCAAGVDASSDSPGLQQALDASRLTHNRDSGDRELQKAIAASMSSFRAEQEPTQAVGPKRRKVRQQPPDSPSWSDGASSDDSTHAQGGGWSVPKSDGPAVLDFQRVLPRAGPVFGVGDTPHPQPQTATGRLLVTASGDQQLHKRAKVKLEKQDDDTPIPPAIQATGQSAVRIKVEKIKVEPEDGDDAPIPPPGPPPVNLAQLRATAEKKDAGSAPQAAEPPVHIDLSGVDLAPTAASGGGAAAAASADLTVDDEAIAKALQISFDSSFGGDVVVSGERSVPGPEQSARDICWRQRRDITSFLRRAAAQLEVDKLDPAPAGQPDAPQYSAFREAWERVQDKRIRLVFHGTPAQNADRIAAEGLDPARRSGQAMGPGEYFATDANTSLGYCRGGTAMLVFAVLMDDSGLTTATGDAIAGGQTEHAVASASSASGLTIEEAQRPVGPGVVVVHRSSHQLPLFVVRFRLKPGYHRRGHRGGRGAAAVWPPLAQGPVWQPQPVWQPPPPPPPLQTPAPLVLPLSTAAIMQMPQLGPYDPLTCWHTVERLLLDDQYAFSDRPEVLAPTQTSQLAQTESRQIFIERPRVRRRPSGDKWLNSGGKNGSTVFWLNSGIGIRKRYGKIVPASTPVTLSDKQIFSEYSLIRDESSPKENKESVAFVLDGSRGADALDWEAVLEMLEVRGPLAAQALQQRPHILGRTGAVAGLIFRGRDARRNPLPPQISPASTSLLDCLKTEARRPGSPANARVAAAVATFLGAHADRAGMLQLFGYNDNQHTAGGQFNHQLTSDEMMTLHDSLLKAWSITRPDRWTEAGQSVVWHGTRGQPAQPRVSRTDGIISQGDMSLDKRGGAGLVQVAELLQGKGPLVAAATGQRPHILQAGVQQILVERPRQRRRHGGDKWLTSGKIGSAIHWLDATTGVRTRYGKVVPAGGGSSRRFKEYALVRTAVGNNSSEDKSAVVFVVVGGQFRYSRYSLVGAGRAGRDSLFVVHN